MRTGLRCADPLTFILNHESIFGWPKNFMRPDLEVDLGWGQRRAVAVWSH